MSSISLSFKKQYYYSENIYDFTNQINIFQHLRKEDSTNLKYLSQLRS